MYAQSTCTNPVAGAPHRAIAGSKLQTPSALALHLHTLRVSHYFYSTHSPSAKSRYSRQVTKSMLGSLGPVPSTAPFPCGTALRRHGGNKGDTLS